MPSPVRVKTCEWCGRDWKTRSPSARTCSPKCRAELREIERPTPGKPKREYPQEIVDLVCGMYLDGMTVAEIRAVAPRGYRVQTILDRYLEVRRPAIKRDQWREKNSMWKGPNAGYTTVHLRLKSELGSAKGHRCIDCGERADDWSCQNNCADEQRVEGKPAYCTHLEHYKPRCRPCHRAYDRQGVMSDV